jgi:C-terminal processing protease CtpA/Prc
MRSTTSTPSRSALRLAAALSALLALLSLALVGAARAQQGSEAYAWLGPQVQARASLADRPRRARPRPATAFGSLTPEQRRAVIDAYWGEGPSTAEKLRVFNKFWRYADEHFAAFQGIDVDWPALRDRYRAEVAAGLSRGRFAAIMNQLTLALRDSHTFALDLPVNVYTYPEPGVPLLAQGGWIFDTSGACLTAQDDGSALVYSAMPNHPLGLEPGDRVLGYDGRPWRDLYRELLREEMPLWPLLWGSSQSAFEHSLVMSAGMNWHLFETMDVAKHATGAVVHVATSRMGAIRIFGFCAEELDVPGVPKPGFAVGDGVSAGIVAGTRIGYVYAWSWLGDAGDDFAAAVHELTQAQRVDGLIIDLRFNLGGFIRAPLNGLAELFEHPQATLAMDGRRSPEDHFAMQTVVPPDAFVVDFADHGDDRFRVKESYDGPVAVLVGPGAVSAGDFSALWASYLPHARTFGKSTSMAAGLPTQPALGTELGLGADWYATVAETNAYGVGAPNDYLIHTELPVDEPVWLRPADVAVGRDTVVEAAVRWLSREAAAG